MESMILGEKVEIRVLNPFLRIFWEIERVKRVVVSVLSPPPELEGLLWPADFFFFVLLIFLTSDMYFTKS